MSCTRPRRVRAGAAIRIGVLALLLGCAARSAGAHPQFALSTVNRYARLLLRPGEARLFYTLMIGDVPAGTLRQQADRSRDGTLDESEQAALAASLRERVQAGVTLALDGAAVPLRWQPAELHLERAAVEPRAFPLELVASFPLELRRPVELRFEDRADIAPIGEVELRLEEAPGVRVEATYEGQSPPAQPAQPPQPAQPDRRLLFQSFGPPRSSLSDRSVHVRVASLSLKAAPLESARPTRPPAWVLAVALGVVALIGLLTLRRRRPG